jgi:hypothetical protein
MGARHGTIVHRRVYSDPTRESDRYALPDVEVFALSQLEANYNRANLDHADDDTLTKAGWYWWACFPGCMPDSDPFGPFDTEEQAIANAQDIS